MHEAFIIVAAVLFLLDFILCWVPNAPGARLSALGLAFLAISFSGLILH
jgi:hypothetical protein